MNKYLITLSAVALSLGATHAAEEVSSLNGGATIHQTVSTVGLAIVVPVGEVGATPDTTAALTPTGVGSSCSAQTSEIDGSTVSSATDTAAPTPTGVGSSSSAQTSEINGSTVPSATDTTAAPTHAGVGSSSSNKPIIPDSLYDDGLF